MTQGAVSGITRACDVRHWGIPSISVIWRETLLRNRRKRVLNQRFRIGKQSLINTSP